MISEDFYINITVAYPLKISITIKEISVWLGHIDFSMTINIYTYVYIEMKKNAAKRIKEMIANVSYN